MTDIKTIDRYDLLTLTSHDELRSYDPADDVIEAWPAGAAAYRVEWTTVARSADGYEIPQPELVVLNAEGNELLRSVDHRVTHHQALWDADVYEAECERENRLWDR